MSNQCWLIRSIVCSIEISVLLVEPCRKCLHVPGCNLMPSNRILPSLRGCFSGKQSFDDLLNQRQKLVRIQLHNQSNSSRIWFILGRWNLPFSALCDPLNICTTECSCYNWLHRASTLTGYDHKKHWISPLSWMICPLYYLDSLLSPKHHMAAFLRGLKLPDVAIRCFETLGISFCMHTT